MLNSTQLDQLFVVMMHVFNVVVKIVMIYVAGIRDRRHITAVGRP